MKLSALTKRSRSGKIQLYDGIGKCVARARTREMEMETSFTGDTKRSIL